MPPLPEPLLDEVSDYASSEDSDFAPDAVPQAAESESSDSELEAEGDRVKKPKTKGATKHTKRKRGKDEVVRDVGFENSGDEEVVEKGLKRRRRKGKKGEKREDEDESGEGGFVRTRKMAAQAIEEKKPLASTTGATVDVDAIWARMTSRVTGQTVNDKTIDVDITGATEATNTVSTKQGQSLQDTNSAIASRLSISDDGEPDDMIIIQRTYNFAGKVHTEEKMVARDSAEARLWLQSQSLKPLSQPGESKFSRPLRPPKKARRSIFEPISEPLPQRTDLQFGLSANPNRLTGQLVNARKLNTVEKSKMDWAGFVDKEGIKDELEMAGKAKGSYMDQTEFLARVDDKREEEARKARLKTLS